MNEELFKILGLCLITAAVVTVFKDKGESGFFVTAAAGTVMALLLFKNIAAPIKTLGALLEENGVETEYFTVAAKAVGIGYVTSFIADICRDAGQTALASKAELAGKCAVFLLGLPLMISVFKTAIGFLQ